MEWVVFIQEKWPSIFFWLVFSLSILALLSKKTVTSEIFIKADANLIWSVLMNTEDYIKWNPLLVVLSGHLEQGEKMLYQWNQCKYSPVKMTMQVMERVEKRLLHQRGGVPGILLFDHYYRLYEKEGATFVVQNETYRGLGVWLWNAKEMKPHYAKVNQALALRVLHLEIDSEQLYIGQIEDIH